MTTVKRIGYALLATVTLALGGTEVLAQQTGGTPAPGAGQGMQGQGNQGMDMQTMANQCAQVRRQRQQNPSAPMSADMQKMMAQCDQMDKMMGGHQSGPDTRGQTK